MSRYDQRRETIKHLTMNQRAQLVLKLPEAKAGWICFVPYSQHIEDWYNQAIDSPELKDKIIISLGKSHKKVIARLQELRRDCHIFMNLIYRLENHMAHRDFKRFDKDAFRFHWLFGKYQKKYHASENMISNMVDRLLLLNKQGIIEIREP
jgi:hypothetical protein